MGVHGRLRERLEEERQEPIRSLKDVGEISWLSRPSCGHSGCVRARDRAHSSRTSRAAAESCRSRSPDPFRHFPTSDCRTAEASPGCAQARAFGLSGVLHTCILRLEENTSELQSIMRTAY